MQLLWGFFLALAVSLAAYWLRLLTRSGAAAAVLLGTIVFGLGGWEWSLVLIGFFGFSSLLTRFLNRRKLDLNAAFAKGGQRDAGQVLANGGLAGLAVLLHGFFPVSAWPWFAFCGALAAANADTWATELGVLSHAAPRLITTFRPVTRGTSGGITLVGTFAALCGAGLIGVLGWLIWPANIPLRAGLQVVAGVSAAGLLGSLVDSLLGATLQAIYYCSSCARETERHPLHTCGTSTTLARGWVWLDNDGVNAVCTAVGLALALAVSLY